MTKEQEKIMDFTNFYLGVCGIAWRYTLENLNVIEAFEFNYKNRPKETDWYELGKQIVIDSEAWLEEALGQLKEEDREKITQALSTVYSTLEHEIMPLAGKTLIIGRFAEQLREIIIQMNKEANKGGNLLLDK